MPFLHETTSKVHVIKNAPIQWLITNIYTWCNKLLESHKHFTLVIKKNYRHANSESINNSNTGKYRMNKKWSQLRITVADGTVFLLNAIQNITISIMNINEFHAKMGWYACIYYVFVLLILFYTPINTRWYKGRYYILDNSG